MDVAALSVALVGLVLGTLSLGWQVASWLLSAGRVHPRLRHGVLSSGSAVLSDVPASGEPSDIGRIREQGFNGPEVLAIAVPNIGRAPVTVARYELGLRGGRVSLAPIADAIGPQLPTRLEPGESEIWMVDMDTVRRFVYAGQAVDPGKYRVDMTVELATGAKRTTKHAIAVAVPG